METRIKKTITDINYNDTKEFFRNRASKYDETKPYCVTMYQDNHSDLVIERTKKEVSVIYPELNISKNSKILDVACGIGRWADSIVDDIDCYLGVDFSPELINIAKSRCKRDKFKFIEGNLLELHKICQDTKYNTILMMGILVYLNDSDIINIIEEIISCCSSNSVVCIREPVTENERLTLNHFYSDELSDTYNAIYRSKKELMEIFEKTFFKHGFKITKQSNLFESNLNNRKETFQYYYILRRNLNE